MKGYSCLIPMLVLPCVCPRSVVAFLISWLPQVEHLPSRASSLARRRTVGTGGAFGQRDYVLRGRDSGGSVLLMREEGCTLDRRELVRAVGAALTSATVSSTIIDFPRQASAAPSASVSRRPASKRSPKSLCDDAVSYLRNPTKQSEVWLVGTAHISDSSAQLVGSVIREIKPQVVMVELDAQRIGGFLEQEQQDRKADGVDSEEEKPRASPPNKKRAPFFGTFFKQLLDPNVSVSDRVTEFFAAALGSAISKMYRTLDQKGLSSGQEFTVAIREARNCGAKILLGDRDVKVTLRRLSEALRSTNLEELTRASEDELGLGLEALDVGSAESISSNLEKMKRRDTMRKVTDFYRREAPELYSAMIGERDKVMAVNLMTLEDKRTSVAVVGLAHVDGIEAILAANGWNLQRC